MAERPTVLVVEARYYPEIADALVGGARPLLEGAGFACERLEVPGTFEIPAAIRFALRSEETESASAAYAGFVALGCVIRGETDHYEHISREVSRALMDLAVRSAAPIGFGVLTCDSYEQAWARADPKQRNKGAEAARACLRMIELHRRFRLAGR